MENLEKKEKITASLFTLKFIPEYYSAERALKKNEPIAAEIYKITGYGIYLNLFNDKIQAKLPVDAVEKDTVKEGDIIRVMITHLTNTRIVVKRVTE